MHSAKTGIAYPPSNQVVKIFVLVYALTVRSKVVQTWPDLFPLSTIKPLAFETSISRILGGYLMTALPVPF